MQASPPVAIVTGSSRGIGRAIVSELHHEGYAVVVNYVRSAEVADEFVHQLNEGQAERAIAAQANVGDADDRQRLVETAYGKWGRLDLLVNNAGITSPGRCDLLEANELDWDTVMQINLKGPFFMAQLAAKRMIQQIRAGGIPRAQIINISSISAYAVSTNRVDYCIAKAGMQMMTWQLATRLADEQINVYEICPGVIASDMTEPVRATYDRLIAEGLTPIRRWGQPQDIARAVATIASGAFPFSTGERFNIDGGFHIRRL